MEEISTQDFTDAINWLGYHTSLGKLAQIYLLAQRKEDREAIENALLRGIQQRVNIGGIFEISQLLRIDGLGEQLSAQIENSLIDALGNVEMMNLFGFAGRFIEQEQLSDTILIAAISTCGKKHDLGSVVKLLKKSDQSDAVMIAAMNVFSENGLILDIVEVVENRRLNIVLQTHLDVCLLRGLEICAKKADAYSIVGLLERLNLSDLVREKAESSLVRAVNDMKQSGRIGEINELLKRKGISEPVRNTIEKILDMGLATPTPCGQVWDYANLLRRKNMDAKTKARTEKALLETIKSRGERGWVEGFADLLEREDLSHIVKAQTEESLLEGIAVCADRGVVCTIADLQQRGGLSQAIMDELEGSLIKGIKACETTGMIDRIVHLLDKEGLSDAVKAQMEKSLIKLIKADGKKGYIRGMAGLFSDKRINDAIRSQIEKSFIGGIQIRESEGLHESRESIFQLADFLEQESLSEPMKAQAEKTLIRAIKTFGECSLIGTDSIAELLGRNSLTDEVIDQIEKSLINGIKYHAAVDSPIWIKSLLQMKGLSEPVFIAAIKTYALYGSVLELAKLLQRDDIGDSLRNQIEASLIQGIGVCVRKEQYYYLADLLEMPGLSDQVRKAVPEDIDLKPYQKLQTVQEYLKQSQNPLANGGVLLQRAGVMSAQHKVENSGKNKTEKPITNKTGN